MGRQGMTIEERYAAAMRSSRLTVDARTTFSDTDVLAGMGLADVALKSGRGHGGVPIAKAPLAVALQRLLCGDNKAAGEVVDALARMAWKRAQASGVRLYRSQAVDVARACLAWFRDGVCRDCGGHGHTLIPGTCSLSAHECKVCKGVGKVPFERQFPPAWRDLACWLVCEMERDLGRAGAQAMRWIAPRLELGGGGAPDA